MKRRVCLLMVVSLAFSLTQAQTRVELDSLIAAHKKSPDHLETLSRLSQIYEFFNSDSAVFYAQKLIKKSKDNPAYTARAYMSIANSHLTNNQFEDAVNYYQMAIDICERESGLDFDKAVYTQALAQAYQNFGDAQTSIQLYLEALSYFLENEQDERSPKFIATVYGGLSDSYRLIGLYDLAIENILKAIQFTKNENDPISLAINYNGLSLIYSSRKDYKKGIEYNDLSLAEFKKAHYPLGEASVLLNQAQNYFDLGHDEKALELATESEEILNSINTNYNLGEVYKLYGQIFRNQNKLDESEQYFKQAIQLHTESGANHLLGTSLMELAKTQYLRGNRTEANHNIQSAIQIFKKIEAPKELSEALQFLLLKKLSNNHELNEVFKEYIEAYDRYLSIEGQNNMIAQEVKFQTAEKEIQIAQQELKIKNEKYKRNIAIGLSFLVLIISAGLFIWLRYRNKSRVFKAKSTLNQLQLSISEMQLNELNQKLDPHEIKNLLASIAPEIQEKAPESYKRMLQLFNITKASLNTTSLTDTLENQLQQSESYILLMRNAIFEPITYSFDNQVGDLNFKIPRLLLKNLVENAIKHGIKGKEGGGHISVKVFEENNCINIEINDTGKGRSCTEINQQGVGISTYLNIFETLNKKNNEKAQLNIVDKKVGTQVEISIPKNYQYE